MFGNSDSVLDWERVGVGGWEWVGVGVGGWKWSGREDLNLRPLAPHASALPGCATPRFREL